ncbi:MAG TPA: peptidylprolyl isomerase, partial [Tepidisphaeraceae bacterium]
MNRTRLTAAIVETLEDRKLLHAPAIDAIPNYTMPAGKHLYVPVTSSYDHSDPVAYTVIDDSSELQATVRTTRSSWIEMQVAGYSEPMVFQLFDDLAPKTVATMKGLVQAGYFDGQLFHRVINNFVLQGGDPKTLQPSSSDNVWGTGGPGFEFDDEFHPATVFSGDGQLAMANSGKDTNGSQFFITEGPQRGLDFNHAIWGQLVRGKATRNAISNTSVDSNSRPTSEIRITRMRVIANTKDTVLAIKANGIASGTVTVFANGAEGNDSQTFNVNSIADVTNDPPILSVPQSVYYTPVNTPIAIRLRGADLEGNPIDMRGAFIDSSGVEAGTIKDNVVRITPKAGFTGTITLYVGAGVVGAQSRGTSSFNESQPLGGIYDTQKITIAVGEKMISGTGTKFVYTSGAPANNIVVANFYDADRRGRASNFQAKINWGDGAITTGTIVQNAD